MSSIFEKHKLEGLGAASAALVLAALAANPSTVFLTTNRISSKLLYWILTKAFSSMASGGLVVMNIGAANLQTSLAKSNFDGSLKSAERLINSIRESGRNLTPQEIKNIDGDVISAFRKFANFGGKKT